MLSPAPMGAAQRGQRERGRMMDSWRGRREMQTLRKLPKARPKRTTKMETIEVEMPPAETRIAVSPLP